MPDAERGRGNETDSAMMNSGKRRIRKDEEEARETRLALEGRGRRKSTEREETSHQQQQLIAVIHNRAL